MPPQFTFTGYIISVIDEKRICVRVDHEHIEPVSAIISRFNERTTIKDTLVVNIKDARFVIAIEWNELADLVGTHAKIIATPRRYSYWKSREILMGDNERHLTTVKYKGVSIIANRVSSVV